jgi:hypothetical protein
MAGKLSCSASRHGRGRRKAAAVGKASRGKKERGRQVTREWDPIVAARCALRDRAATTLLLENNHYAAAYFAAATDRVFQRAMWHHIRLGLSPARAWHETAAWMMGEAGYSGPWSHDTQLIADYGVWELEQQLSLLRNGELCVISPTAHTAVVAAALTLDVPDLLTLDRETDVPLPSGLVVMPEPVVILSRNADLGDLRVLGWDFSTMYGAAGEEYRAVGISGMLRTDGPTQTPAWREFLAEAKADGYQMPPWFPAGTNGMRADASSRSTASHAAAVARADARHALHRDVGELIRADLGPVPEPAQWSGKPIEDPYNNFTDRYLFAFWRLLAQGTTTMTRETPPSQAEARFPAAGGAAYQQESGMIRIVDLR